MGRRGLHDEGSELLRERLKGKIEIDLDHRPAAFYADLRAAFERVSIMSRVMTVPFAFIFCAFRLICAGCAHAVTVPFVGCNSMMQGEERPAPQGKPIKFVRRSASRFALAFYQSASDDGVYAPRGWHCANLGGSNGWMLFVAPYPIKPDDFLMPHRITVAGPFYSGDGEIRGTSGRFDVARLIARYFPEQRGFARSVIAEKIEPASGIPVSPLCEGPAGVPQEGRCRISHPAPCQRARYRDMAEAR